MGQLRISDDETVVCPITLDDEDVDFCDSCKYFGGRTNFVILCKVR